MEGLVADGVRGPGVGEGFGSVVGGVGDGGGLVEIGRQGGEFGRGGGRGGGGGLKDGAIGVVEDGRGWRGHVALLFGLLLFVVGGSGRGGVGVGFGGEGDGTRRLRGGGGHCFGGREEASVGCPCGCGGGGVGVGGLDAEGSDSLARLLDEVEGAGLEGEGDGLGEIGAGVFELGVDEEGDWDEACGGGVGEVAGPLVYSDGAGDGCGGGGLVGLGMEGRKPECGEDEEAADEGPEVHACDGSRGECEDFYGNCGDYVR